MIILWLINYIETRDWLKGYMILPTAKELWDAMVETYLDMRNSAQVFEITNKIKKLK